MLLKSFEFIGGCLLTVVFAIGLLILIDKLKRRKLIKRAYKNRDERFWRDWTSFKGEYADNIIGEDFSTKREVKNN